MQKNRSKSVFVAVFLPVFIAFILGAGVGVCWAAMPCCKAMCPQMARGGMSAQMGQPGLSVEVSAPAMPNCCAVYRDRIAERSALALEGSFFQHTPVTFQGLELDSSWRTSSVAVSKGILILFSSYPSVVSQTSRFIS